MLDRCCMGLWSWEKMERSEKKVQTTLYTIFEELIRVFKNILADYLFINVMRMEGPTTQGTSEKNPIMSYL